MTFTPGDKDNLYCLKKTNSHDKNILYDHIKHTRSHTQLGGSHDKQFITSAKWDWKRMKGSLGETF